jgi:hypothetical protein
MDSDVIEVCGLMIGLSGFTSGRDAGSSLAISSFLFVAFCSMLYSAYYDDLGDRVRNVADSRWRGEKPCGLLEAILQTLWILKVRDCLDKDKKLMDCSATIGLRSQCS